MHTHTGPHLLYIQRSSVCHSHSPLTSQPSPLSTLTQTSFVFLIMCCSVPASHQVFFLCGCGWILGNISLFFFSRDISSVSILCPSLSSSLHLRPWEAGVSLNRERERGSSFNTASIRLVLLEIMKALWTTHLATSLWRHFYFCLCAQVGQTKQKTCVIGGVRSRVL